MAVVGPRLARRSAGRILDPIAPPLNDPEPDEPEPDDPEPGLAHRRAAIELHRRSLDAALVALADRECFETELRAGDSSRSVVAVTFDGVTFDGVTFDGVTCNEQLVDQAMRRLSSIVRQDTTVHRVGDSHLIVVVLGDRYVADSIARRVTEAFRSPFSVGGRDLVAVTGVGLASVDPADPEAAVRRADLAARRAAVLTN